MKKFKLFLMLLAVVFVLPTTVLAAETEVEDYDGLLTCVGTDGSTCKLTADIELEAAVKITKNITIDLNGNSIAPKVGLTDKTGVIFVQHGGTLTINDATGEGSILSGDGFYASIQMTSVEDTDNTKAATLIVNGGTLEGKYYAITGNGNPGRDNTVITINGGTLKSDYTAIYHPQRGTLNIKGGEIIGKETGIEMRAGDLIMTAGKVTGNGVPVKTNPNGSGTTTTGAGIALSQHTTALPTSVTISGGTINGYSALYQASLETTNDPSKVSLNVSGGTFNAINGGTVVVYSEDKTAFISGGTYSSVLDEKYIKVGYEINEGEDSYNVALISHEVELPVVDLEEIEEIEEVGTTGSDKLEEVLTNSLGSLELDEGTKTTVSLEIEMLEEEDLEEEVLEEITKEADKLTVATYFDVSVAVRDYYDNSNLGNITKLTEEIELMILLPEDLKEVKEGLERVYYVLRRHINEEGKAEIEKIKATVSEDEKYLVFKTDRFSTYALAYEDVEPTLPPQTGDGISTYFIIGALSLIALVGIGVLSKKKLFN